MTTIRLTMAQALVKYLAALRVEMEDGSIEPYCGGVFTIFGHGNVAGMGEALWAERATLPTFRAHNEQGMAHAAGGTQNRNASRHHSSPSFVMVCRNCARIFSEGSHSGRR